MLVVWQKRAPVKAVEAIDTSGLQHQILEYLSIGLKKDGTAKRLAAPLAGVDGEMSDVSQDFGRVA